MNSAIKTHIFLVFETGIEFIIELLTNLSAKVDYDKIRYAPTVVNNLPFCKKNRSGFETQKNADAPP